MAESRKIMNHHKANLTSGPRETWGRLLCDHERGAGKEYAGDDKERKCSSVEWRRCRRDRRSIRAVEKLVNVCMEGALLPVHLHYSSSEGMDAGAQKASLGKT